MMQQLSPGDLFRIPEFPPVKLIPRFNAQEHGGDFVSWCVYRYDSITAEEGDIALYLSKITEKVEDSNIWDFVDQPDEVDYAWIWCRGIIRPTQLILKSVPPLR